MERFMTCVGAGASQVTNPGKPWLAAVASLVVAASFFALWFWLLPNWLGFDIIGSVRWFWLLPTWLGFDMIGSARWRWIGTVPSVLGFAVALRCVWDFGWTGHGTPAPFAPPQRLVVVGFYRYVRNPMYVGTFAGWSGLWVAYGRANLAALAVASVAMAGVVLFVRLYEEPTLRKTFGTEYEEYCRNVRRWLPRMRAWTK